MAQTTKATRQNRPLTVDFQDPSTYFELINDGKAFVVCVLAFILSIGFQLAHIDNAITYKGLCFAQPATPALS